MAGITKDNLFRPVPSKAEAKSDVTTRTAKAMIEAETASREAKTARLRKARLAMEAEQPAPPPSKPRARKASKQNSASAG